MTTAVLASGGLDSSALLRDLAAQRDPVYPLYIRTGLLWETAEIHWLERFLDAAEIPGCAPLTILDLPVTGLYGELAAYGPRREPGLARLAVQELGQTRCELRLRTEVGVRLLRSFERIV
jgi:hypothetical protein